MTKLQDSQAGSVSRTRELRQHPRRKLAGMAYVELAQDNGGILLNLSEGGLAIQSALALNSKEFPDLRFQLPNMRGWLTGSGRAVWISESKKEAGIQFLDLHEHARAQIRLWVAKEGLEDEPEHTTRAGVGGAEPIASANDGEPGNGGHPSARVRRHGVERSTPARIPENPGAPARHTEIPAAQDDRSFRFNDYSMFAADANTGVPWIEPVKQRRSWGTYILFTILLAALFFVLGAMIGRDNLNGLVKRVQGEAPPSAKAPAPPEIAESGATPASEGKTSASTSPDSQSSAPEQPSTGPSQTGSTGENPGQANGVAPEQQNPTSAKNEQPSAVDRAATSDGGAAAQAGGAAAGAPPTKAETASEALNASKPRERGTSTSKGARLPRREPSYSDADVTESSEYGRSILVNAPPPGSPPFFVNLPGEPVSASSWVAISARRSIQVPPRVDVSASGSQRLIVGKLLAHSDPFYPTEAQAKRIEGIVELHALVGRSGQVISVTPVSGPGVLMAAGATALHEWRYEPTFINGDPVETHVDVTMVFRSR